jgi:hypothetical protein
MNMEPFVRLLIDQKYPYFFICLGLLVVVSFLLGIGAIVALFFSWKLSLACVGVIILLRVIGQWCTNYVVNSVLNK